MENIPFIRNNNGKISLYVSGKPYLILEGEIRNSNASDLEYMDDQIWKHLKEMNINTLLVPIYWELIEKESRYFNFTLLDGILKQARYH